ncbi:PEP-CTERM sorting domain-containing protein [Paraglaciecola aquimarina]|uniref:PEP-CTERM sorting domain-containing protein n=1 Tax=Paraglaciecola algarum TaxID=3050085 RepID=A0ABS9DD37_9ALTE|nr:PEP-CTERM sorting domain-containing protein [Paraglaciecola sp. G1-23]MCF2949898.1 PEP-CTERM sorting domain-containing protein [Paraglaciecola sp. G1-23]
MKKLLAIGLLSLFIGGQAQAGFIKSVTGADMAGIEVTVTYDDATTDSAIWGATFPEEGAANGADWGLYEQGDTIGGDNGQFLYGVWTFTRSTNAIKNIASLFIDTSTTNIVFDTEFFDVSANGSGAGREFTYDDKAHDPVTALFSGLYMDELYTGLTISGPGLVDGFQFMIDTDEVPAPTTLSIMLLALGGLVARRLKA